MFKIEPGEISGPLNSVFELFPCLLRAEQNKTKGLKEKSKGKFI